MLRNRLINLGLIIASVYFTVLVLEGGARLFYETMSEGSCVIEHPTAIYQNTPNCANTVKLVENEDPVTYEFNECGYRTPY